MQKSNSYMEGGNSGLQIMDEKPNDFVFMH